MPRLAVAPHPRPEYTAPAMNRRPGPNATPFATRAHKPIHFPTVNPYRDAHESFGPELIAAEDAPKRKGAWAAEFGRITPLNLELGTGNGSWLATRAASAPAEDWIGLEIRYKRCVQTAEKVVKAGAGNARVVRYSWFELESLFEPGELAAIYIHHPDPWSSWSKAKHRLIKPEFVAAAARLVRAGGELRLKTDFLPHRDALLAALPAAPEWQLIGTSDDVRSSGAPWPDEIVTGYQAKFDGLGLPVYAAWLRRV